jgi:RimJ/RimL family protein N-acetyltransferase
MSPAEALRRLAQDAVATFDLCGDGRFRCENDPDRSPGPRLFLAGCPGGNLVRLRHDVGEATAACIRARLADEPPWSDPEVRPTCLLDLTDLLSREGPVEVMGSAVIHALPRGLAFATRARIVRSETEEGGRLLARLARDGMPQALAEAGFVGVGDFWAPWCVAFEGDQIAAMAFAARTGRRGASIGVYAFPRFRGRGLAAAVTADWANHPGLAGRALFYSALSANTSSLRVIARLGLPPIGVSLRMG